MLRGTLILMSMMNTTRTREDLVAEYKRLGRAMSNETQNASDYEALRIARNRCQAEIEALDANKDS